MNARFSDLVPLYFQKRYQRVRVPYRGTIWWFSWSWNTRQAPGEVDPGADLEHGILPKELAEVASGSMPLSSAPRQSDEYKIAMMKVSPASVSQQDEE